MSEISDYGSGADDLYSGKIMVVEDDLMQRLLLAGVLESQGYQVIHAENGRQALDSLDETSPDLIISDIMMPEMDGLELCRRVKGRQSTTSIPFMLVTALDTRDDILNGIDAGANEFLTKPIEPRELVLRVRNAIRFRKLYEEVEKNLLELRDLEAMRDNLVHMVVHDMRSVLTGILSTADFLQSRLSGRMDATDEKLFSNILTNSTTLMEMVSTVLDVSRMEEGKMPVDRSVIDLNAVLMRAFELMGVSQNCERVRYSLPDKQVYVDGDAGMLCRVVTNLISNGLKYTRARKDGMVEISLRVVDGTARVEVSDNGQGIPSSDSKLIFEKFAQSSLRQQKKRYSSGLGLYFCKLAIESHRGRIGVESNTGQGATFYFELETCPPSAQRT
jgi:K+-sensing histidine kinase KdpD